MAMAYDCHSIPADCAKVAVDEGEGTGNLLCFISQFFGLNNVLISQWCLEGGLTTEGRFTEKRWPIVQTRGNSKLYNKRIFLLYFERSFTR